MRSTLYTCDFCKSPLSDDANENWKNHFFLELRSGGIASAKVNQAFCKPKEAQWNTHLRHGFANRTLHFCNTDCIKGFFVKMAKEVPRENRPYVEDAIKLD